MRWFLCSGSSDFLGTVVVSLSRNCCFFSISFFASSNAGFFPRGAAHYDFTHPVPSMGAAPLLTLLAFAQGEAPCSYQEESDVK